MYIRYRGTVDLAARAPLFALMVYGSGAMLAWALWSASQPMRARLPRPLRWTLVASLSLWAVVGCGEGVRAALMETQLMGDAPACHETRSLIDVYKRQVCRPCWSKARPRRTRTN